MRRPMVLVSGGFSLGIVVSYFTKIYVFLGIVALIMIAMFLLCIVLWERLRIHVWIVSLFLLTFLIGGIFLGIAENQETQRIAVVGQHMEVHGRVTSVMEKTRGEYYQFTLKTDRDKILVSIYGDVKDYRNLVGKKVTVDGKIQLPKEKRNPRTFDYRLYLKTVGISTVTVIKPHQFFISEENNELSFNDGWYFIANKLSVFKGYFANKVEEATNSAAAAMISGMLFGEKNFIDENLYEQFQKNGVSHILAVSGLHVGLVYGCISKIFANKRSIFGNALAILGLIIYAALASFSPSVIRAVSMIIMHIISKLLHKRYDLLVAAATVALFTLLINPYAIFNTGFQLSYLAIVSLAVIMMAIGRRYNGMFLPIVSVQLGMIPVTAYLFNYFSPMAILANVPVIFLAGLIIPMGLLLMVLSLFTGNIIFQFCFDFVATSVELFVDIMVYINKYLYMDGLFAFRIISPSVFFLVLYYGGIFFAFSEMALVFFKRKNWKLLISGGIIICISGIFGQLITADGFENADIVFIDVGQGDCLFAKTPRGKTILIDGGGSPNYDVGKNILMPYLLKNGVKKIDMAFVTHRHKDHYDGIKNLAKIGMVKKLCLYEANSVIEDEIIHETGMKKENLIYLGKGDRITVEKGIWVEILYPEKNTECQYKEIIESDDENSSSLIIKVCYDEISVIMTGDVGMDLEKEMVEKYNLAKSEKKLNATILKISHHGSKYSSCDELLASVSPKLAVIQVGKNNYGHPSERVIESCIKKGIIVYRNDMDGAIGICNIKDGAATVKTMCER